MPRLQRSAGLQPSSAACRGCGRAYPARDGRPALLDPDGPYGADPAAPSPRRLGKPGRPPRRLLPRLTGNPRSASNFRRFADLAVALAGRPRLLAVGCGDGGEGIAEALADPRLEWLETDIRWTSRAALLADVHQIPFEDGSFDGVVLQAVLEHVLDPARAVAEAHRVLRPGGLIYAETPFLQHVHAGAHDLTRFTHVGHRRLFRGFAEIDSGAASGPGAALAWAGKVSC